MSLQAMADRTKRGFVERLFAEHRGALHAYFHRRIRTKADALDLVQEVYLRMLRVSDPDSIRSPQMYLYTVANNLVKEHALSDRRAAARLDIDELSVQEQLGELPSLESELDANRQTQRVRELLAQLPLNWRTAVILQYRYGLTYQEIAAQLQVSPSMVKKYLARALDRCRRELARLE
jgi:RNA polymerase sigma-70 factor (ECF subfamily)